MCYDYSVYVLWCFGALVLIIYFMALISAIISWKRYKFSGWLFIPMVLLFLCPAFIFPIYSYAEYAVRKRSGNGVDYRGRLKKFISWLPAISLFVSSWIFRAIDYFAIDINRADDGPVASTLTYVVGLLFSIAILWLGRRIDKLKADN